MTRGAVDRPPFIGLTGGIAAGKSEVLRALGELGAETLSADAVVHELLGTAEVRERLVERWGPEVAAGDSVDRNKVGAIVFADPAELAWLESELHPLVGERVGAWAAALPAETELAVVEVPLLFETAMEDGFDATVAVVAEEGVRAERAGGRELGELEGRGARQLGQDEKASRADFVIRNDGSLADLRREVAAMWPKLTAVGAPA